MPAMDYEIRRSPRARRVRVNVDPVTGAVEVVVPQRAPANVAAEAVAELRGWIGKRVDEASAARAVVRARGDTLPYLGERLALVPEQGRTRVHRVDDRLMVPAGDAKPALERWYRRRARAEVQPRLDAAVARIEARYTTLRIGGQRTRWGSCSAKGAMSFNWRLLLAPAEILDYVIWHEACHLRVLDHSPRFWALVAEHCPEHERKGAWLRTNGATLVL